MHARQLEIMARASCLRDQVLDDKVEADKQSNEDKNCKRAQWLRKKTCYYHMGGTTITRTMSQII